MKLKKIHIEKFKRFTNLTINNLPDTAKLIVLVGPNGCGKSSLFDAFKTWHMMKAYSNVASEDYCRKEASEKRAIYELVGLEFHENITKLAQKDFRNFFYFRTAYRNSPKINVTALQKLSSPLDRVDGKMMIQNDSTVDDNYQRLMAETVSKVYDKKYDNTNVGTLREELIGKIREPLKRLFPDLTLTEIGMVTDKAEFYFSKGTIDKYGYEKLSGGEKAAFDLLLDIVIKSEFYKNTVFCIDEPETHIHTKLQSALLSEIFHLIPKESQLWIATHSFGMLKEAKRLLEDNPNEIVFLNFDGYDFDDVVEIEPTACDETIWNKMIEISLDDYAPYLSPEIIVFCEGTTKGRKRKDFDARCYTNIFRNKYPNIMFFSLGSCNEVEEKNTIIDFVTKLSPNSKVIRLVDRDDRTEEEIADLKAEGICVLNKRHIEGYLLDDTVLQKWCVVSKKEEKIEEILKIKQQKMNDSIARGNAYDDVKSAGNDICVSIKKYLFITQCGNSGEMIMRDTLSKLITPDMAIYQELERDILGYE